MAGKGKKKSSVVAPKPSNGTKAKSVEFKEPVQLNGSSTITVKSGLRPSPSMNTLNRLEREKIVLWQAPFTTIYYSLVEITLTVVEFIQSLIHHKLLLFFLTVLSSGIYYAYITPGDHQKHVAVLEKSILWYGWWVFLGVLSSIGFGSGLHTFLMYLGPHIATVTMAAYECNSLDFPEPPYPESVICPEGKTAAGAAAITLWQIVSKVRVESLLWGAGTALGELPPYFMARAARLSGQEPDDEEYKEFLEFLNAEKQGKKDELGMMDRAKMFAEKFISKVGFPGILLFASIPNPLFDLAGITCGHFLVPFWSFFGATLIGKAIVKMHVQMLFVIVAFSEHHVEEVVNLLGKLPVVGEGIRQPIRDLLAKQKKDLHRKPGTPVVQDQSWLQILLGLIVLLMILTFLVSIINSLAQRYHKRQCDKKKKLN